MDPEFAQESLAVQLARESTGHFLVIFNAGTSLMAMRFERATGTARGTPVPVLDNVMASQCGPVPFVEFGMAMVNVAADGTLLYLSGGLLPAQRLDLVAGSADGDPNRLSDARVSLSPRVAPDGRRVLVASSEGLLLVRPEGDIARTGWGSTLESERVMDEKGAIIMSIDASRVRSEPDGFVATLVALTVVLAGCGSGAGPGAAETPSGATYVEEVRIGVTEGADPYMIGQVEHLAVSADGTIYAADEQVGTVRIYGPEGRHRGDAGRIGEGPGEYRMVNGLQVLPDGRVAVLDIARVVIFDSEGRSAGAFDTRSGSRRGRLDLEVDDAGRLLLFALLEARDAEVSRTGRPRTVYDVYEPNGSRVATIDQPRPERAPGNRPPPNSSGLPFFFGLRTAGRPLLPFTTVDVWTWSPGGYFLVGRSDAYEVEARVSTRVLFTLARDIPPTPIREAELREWQAIGEFLRQDRAARYGIRSEPAIFASVKPYFREIYAGREGRVWIWRYVDAHKSVPLPDYSNSGRPLLTWREPPTFDGFSAKGEYLGTVVLPVGFDPLVWRGDRVWGVHEDETGVRFILGLKLTPSIGLVASDP